MAVSSFSLNVNQIGNMRRVPDENHPLDRGE
jgi:hypothetical protein